MRARSILSLLGASTAVASVVAAASSANAQEKWAKGKAPFGARAQNVLVADDFVGVYRETVYSPDAQDTSDTGLLRVGSGGGVYALNETTRFGYHRFLTPEISLGTGIHLTSRDASIGAVIVAEQQKATVFGVSPRVGFVFASSDSGAFWFRFGFQYYHYGFDGDTSAWDLGPGVELLYVITPFEHFGITLGPMMELQIAGNLHVAPSSIFGGAAAGPAHDTALRRRTFGFALGFLFDL